MREAVRGSCVHHPSARARRRCFQCLSPICPSCQIRAHGHIFCSDRCRRRHWISERRERWREAWLRVWLRGRRLGRAADRATGGGLLRSAHLLLLTALLYQTVSLTVQVRGLSLGPAGGVALPGPPSVEVQREGDRLTVTGSAEGFAVAVLLTDGREREVGQVLDGRFRFSIEAAPDERTVQVAAFGDRVPSLHSRSLPIPEPQVPASSPSTAALPVGPPAPERKPVARATVAAPSDAEGPPAPKTTPAPTAAGPAVTSAARPQAPSPAPERRQAALPASALASDVSRGDPQSRMVATTFGGGSHSNSAGEILDVLRERRLRATFFLTGEFIRRYPEVTRRIAAEGHEVGNHTFGHPHLTTFEQNHRHDSLPGVDRRLVLEELRRNEELFTEVTGSRMARVWRAPYGEHNEAIRRWAAEAGYRHVSWTFDPRTRRSLDGLDWVADRESTLYLSSVQIVDKILSFDTATTVGLAGGIVLLHLGSERTQDPFHARLGQLIDGLARKGLRVGPVSEMMAAGG